MRLALQYLHRIVAGVLLPMFMAKLGALLALLGTRCLIAPHLSTKRGLFGAKASAFGAKKFAHVIRLGAQTLGQGVAHRANGNFTHPP